MAKKKVVKKKPSKQDALRKKVNINKGGLLAALRKRKAAIQKQMDALN